MQFRQLVPFALALALCLGLCPAALAAQDADPYAKAAAIDLDDGSYEAEGRIDKGADGAKVDNPCLIDVKDGRACVTITLSGVDCKALLVDGVSYPKLRDDGAKFQIPLADAGGAMVVTTVPASAAAKQVEHKLFIDVDNALKVANGMDSAYYIALVVVVVAGAVIARSVSRSRRNKEMLG